MTDPRSDSTRAADERVPWEVCFYNSESGRLLSCTTLASSRDEAIMVSTLENGEATEGCKVLARPFA